VTSAAVPAHVCDRLLAFDRTPAASSTVQGTSQAGNSEAPIAAIRHDRNGPKSNL